MTVKLRLYQVKALCARMLSHDNGPSEIEINERIFQQKVFHAICFVKHVFYNSTYCGAIHGMCRCKICLC